VEQLLPYYERELGYLRRNLRDFAERYPKIAGRLLIGGEVCEDPHIERMIESFAPLAKNLAENEQKIVAELLEIQGKPVDIGGYYQPDNAKVKAVMRPSATFNQALASAA
jgi:monomeric isocitrate dehydrogenase